MLVEIGKMEGGVGREGNSFIWMLVRFQGRPQSHNAAIKRIKQTSSGICCNLQRTVRSIGVETPKAWDTERERERERERGECMWWVHLSSAKGAGHPLHHFLPSHPPRAPPSNQIYLPFSYWFFLTSALYQSVFEKLVKIKEKRRV